MLTGIAGSGTGLAGNISKGEPGTWSNKLETNFHTWVKVALLFSGKQVKITLEKPGLMHDAPCLNHSRFFEKYTLDKEIDV